MYLIKSRLCGLIIYIFSEYGRVAQLVEQRSPKPQVAGSSPVSPALENGR